MIPLLAGVWSSAIFSMAILSEISSFVLIHRSKIVNVIPNFLLSLVKWSMQYFGTLLCKVDDPD
jgi:hypothetical protein